MGIRDKPAAPASPWQNGVAERLDRSGVSVWTTSLSWAKCICAESCETRTHLSLNKDVPVSRVAERAGNIVCRPILGGLHHQYARI
jgi:hypothetical protein